jgi:hypothetical protein
MLSGKRSGRLHAIQPPVDPYLGDLADLVAKPDIFPYADIPNFPVSTVPGHAGRYEKCRLCIWPDPDPRLQKLTY